MIDYQPCQCLTWYYNQNEGILKIKSYVSMKYNPVDGARRITSSASVLVKDIGAIVTLTVHADGTADPNPASEVNSWNVSNLGQNLSQAEVRSFIGTLKQYQVMATVTYNGVTRETVNSSAQNSELEYS
jgi:hypothetical protein